MNLRYAFTLNIITKKAVEKRLREYLFLHNYEYEIEVYDYGLETQLFLTIKNLLPRDVEHLSKLLEAWVVANGGEVKKEN